jgi:CRP/FNR family transcriptional regulator, cyclic AMP receptor protein
MDTLEILKANELFKHLSEHDLEKLAAATSAKSAPKNTFIINEGDDSNAFYLIKSGKVDVIVNNEEGKKMILTTLVAGDHFGELSLIDGQPRSATVVAMEKCDFIVLHRDSFYSLLKDNNSFAVDVIKYLCKRLRFITNTAQDIALLATYERVRKVLYSLSEPNADGLLQTKFPLTHEQIADRIGAGRERVCQIINGLKIGDYISITNHYIVINKKLPQAF